MRNLRLCAAVDCINIGEVCGTCGCARCSEHPHCEHCPAHAGKLGGHKDDFGKDRFDLLPPNGIGLVVKVLTKGGEKYAPENWRKVKGWRWRYAAAALRHVFAWMRGEKLDPEWGLPHLAHAACCILFLLELDE